MKILEKKLVTDPADVTRVNGKLDNAATGRSSHKVLCIIYQKLDNPEYFLLQLTKVLDYKCSRHGAAQKKLRM